jgi:membrane fusion protein, multidrug efflux system
MITNREMLWYLVLPLLAACGADARAESEVAAPRPAPVRVAEVRDESVARPVTGTGTLQAKEEVTLGFKIGGIVARIAAEEGQTVRRGQVLATLDLREIDAQVSKARSGAAKAERDLARIRGLYADSVATLEQMQNATTGVEVARAELQAAEFNRQFATIVAPADGIVLRRFAEGGELVSPGAPVLVIGAAGSGLVLRVGVADRDVVRLRLGDRATVRFDAFPGAEFAGRVTQVGAAANPQTGTYSVEVSVEPGGRTLVSGLVGRVEIISSEAGTLPTVPIEAIVEADGERGTVFALAHGAARAERREVRVAFVQGGRVAVAGGLEGVARVVTDGAAYLNDGQSVEVLP